MSDQEDTLKKYNTKREGYAGDDHETRELGQEAEDAFLKHIHIKRDTINAFCNDIPQLVYNHYYTLKPALEHLRVIADYEAGEPLNEDQEEAVKALLMLPNNLKQNSFIDEEHYQENSWRGLNGEGRTDDQFQEGEMDIVDNLFRSLKKERDYTVVPRVGQSYDFTTGDGKPFESTEFSEFVPHQIKKLTDRDRERFSAGRFIDEPTKPAPYAYLPVSRGAAHQSGIHHFAKKYRSEYQTEAYTQYVSNASAYAYDAFAFMRHFMKGGGIVNQSADVRLGRIGESLNSFEDAKYAGFVEADISHNNVYEEAGHETKNDDPEHSASPVQNMLYRALTRLNDAFVHPESGSFRMDSKNINRYLKSAKEESKCVGYNYDELMKVAALFFSQAAGNLGITSDSTPKEQHDLLVHDTRSLLYNTVRITTELLDQYEHVNSRETKDSARVSIADICYLEWYAHAIMGMPDDIQIYDEEKQIACVIQEKAEGWYRDRMLDREIDSIPKFSEIDPRLFSGKTAPHQPIATLAGPRNAAALYMAAHGESYGEGMLDFDGNVIETSLNRKSDGRFRVSYVAGNNGMVAERQLKHTPGGLGEDGQPDTILRGLSGSPLNQSLPYYGLLHVDGDMRREHDEWPNNPYYKPTSNEDQVRAIPEDQRGGQYYAVRVDEFADHEKTRAAHPYDPDDLVDFDDRPYKDLTLLRPAPVVFAQQEELDKGRVGYLSTGKRPVFMDDSWAKRLFQGDKRESKSFDKVFR